MGGYTSSHSIDSLSTRNEIQPIQSTVPVSTGSPNDDGLTCTYWYKYRHMFLAELSTLVFISEAIGIVRRLKGIRAIILLS
nr:MAG TPA: hypothetical protein [Bacteriophage sp.]